jgi:hypothetical protein
MKTNKLQELVSTQVANAINTAKDSANAEQSSTSKASKKKATKSKEDTQKASIKKVTAPKSKKEQVTEEVVKQQNANIVEQVISNREVKYIYPSSVVDTLSRKRWRQATRNELHKLEREMFRIQDQNSQEFKDARKKYEDYKAKVLKPEQVA